MSVKAPGKGNSAKHTGTRKHSSTSKHTKTHHRTTAKAHGAKAHAVAKHATHAKARGFAIGDLLPVCAFEAIAMSLRLAGQPVHEDDVAGLWWRAGAGIYGAAIGDAIADAVRFELAGCRPCRVGQVSGDDLQLARRGSLVRAQPLDGIAEVGRAQFLRPEDRLSRIGIHHLEVALNEGVQQVFGHALILGIDVPGPHCVLATTDGWWSWGELWSPWPARIEEAWAISWA